MTTIYSAAAWRFGRPVTSAAFAAVLALGLAGCETSSSLFSSNGSNGPSAIPLAGDTTTQQQTTSQIAKVSVAPVIGAPEAIAKQLQSQIAANVESQKVSIARSPTDPAEFTLRGYVVSAREKTRTRVSYIWDVTDQAGKRVNRITGEELVVGPQKDPWAAVTPDLVNTIAAKTASSLAAWLPTHSAAAVAANGAAAASTAQPVAQAAPAPIAAAPAVAGSVQTAPQQQTAALAPVPVPASTPTAANATTTGSIARDTAVTALVPSVIGAPGDGGVALTSALQRELSKSGVSLATAPGTQTYKIEGKVAVGAGQNGKQPIQIDWTVYDATGKKLGSVSQKNEVPQGSLDGPWGKVADAAASAAAQGIVKLLPQPAKTN